MEEMAENELLNKIADDFFIKQFKEIVDQQIEAQGFPELCKRTVIKELKDTVQKIQDEQLGIKRLIINSVSRYNNLLTSKKNERNPSREENSRVKSSSNASNNLVIVIDDEDDECVDFTTPKTSVSLTSSSTLSLIATSSCSTAPVEISLLSPLSPKDLPITDRVSKSPDIKIYNDSNERTVEHSNHDNSQVLAFSTNSCTTSTEKNLLLTSSSPTISQLTFLGADVARGSLEKCNNEPNICSLGTDVARDNLEKCNNEPNVCSLEKNSPNLENKSINNDLDSPNHEKLDLNNESFKTVHAMDNQDLTIYEPKSRSLRDEEREHTSVLSDDGRKEVSISDSQLLNSDLFNEEKSFNSEKDLHKKSDVESSPPSSPMLTKIISADSSPLPEASSADIETFSPDVFSAPSSQDVPSSPDSQILLRNKQKATSVKFNHRDHSLVYARPDKSDIWYQAEIIKELTPYRNERRFQVHFLSGQKVTQKILIRSVASIHSIDSSIVEIGSRIVAPRPSDTVNSAISKKYKDINNSAGVISVMFAGVVAEVACEQNKFRYLIFFDDGYAQYLPLKKLFPVVFVSKYVWSDVSTECRDFIKEYLQDYPYRPLLNAKIGCAMETEWNGSWWKSKVVSFDGSLIKILFDIDKRSEWVYKGTSRLEPLYKYFTNSANSKNKSKKNDWFIDEKITHPNFGICRYSLKDPKGYQQRLLWDVENQQGEYICQKKENDPKEANPLKLKLININSLKRSNSALSSSSDSSKNSHTEIKHSLKKRRVISDTEESSPERNTKNATLNQEAFSVSSVVEMSPLESTCSISTSSSIGNGMSPSTPLEPSAISSSDDISKKSVMSSNSVLSNTQEDDLKSSLHIHYVPHTCSCACIKDSRNYFDQHRLGIYNYLSIPFQLGWKRESSKKKVNYHRDIYYRAPCGKRMRNLSEVTKYLTQTECKNVCIDMFCFQSNVSCRNHTSKTKPALYRNEDISNGKEICPVVCVNEISTEPPPHVTYINYRIKADDVSINTDPGFLVCCDCTDNCQDKATCQCAKLTIESSNAIDGEIDKNSGYHFRRLKECIATGIYECNQNCACSPVTCYNRVVQNGIQLRLQVFLTENRGWGLRCVDDIPKGTFVCTYAGQVLNEQTANKEGIDFGDEYLAELDHIEVVEQAKEGYESDVPELSNHSIDDMSSEEWQSDSSYSVVLISSDSTDSSDNDDTHPAVKSKDKCENPVKKEQQVTCVETKSENTETSKVTEIRHVAKKSTGAKVHSYMSHRGKFFMTQRLDAAASNKTSKSSNHLSTRYLYQNDNQMFILDAKSYGNVGRYMNHSCNPNLFVQNVMVDTHDLRFPWVAFFTQHNITAYTELTWDYNYEVGSVPNKQISCKCGSKQCKGRLL